MGSPLPPDPYSALGVPRDATAAQIKQVYRKAVLKFHPDKVTDESQKQAASGKFHTIQSSYEIIGDEERRARYDAQIKLAELRKDVMNRQGASSTVSVPKGPPGTPGRTSAYSSRGTGRPYQAQEVRPGSGSNDYFDIPRASARKDPYEYERERDRESRREPLRTERERSKVAAKEAKEYARMNRRENDRRSSRDTRRDRDIKESARYAPPASMVDDDSDTESDDSYAYERERERERNARRRRDEEEREREREKAFRAKERERFYEQQRRQDDSYFAEERERKVSSQQRDARDYIDRSTRSKGGRSADELEDRPMPQRKGSSRDQVEYIKRGDGRAPVMVRRGSDRPRPSESPRRSSTRDVPRRSSVDIVEEPSRAPPLTQSKSSPDQIRIPGEKQRAQSLQTDFDHRDDAPTPPTMRRAETMPIQQYNPSSRRKESTAPVRSSGLRQTEINDGGLPTPSATPEYTGGRPAQYKYGTQYADDREFPTPDGYRTEIIEPANGKPAQSQGRYLNRSPSPISETRAREDSRPKPRAASSRYPEPRPHPPRLDTTSRTTSYKYTPTGVEAMSPDSYSPKPATAPPTSASRPKLGREDSVRGSRQQVPLYGEIPTTRSPVQQKSRYSPPGGHDVQYQREITPKDIKYQTGFSQSRRGSERPAYAASRSNSYSQQPVHAR